MEKSAIVFADRGAPTLLVLSIPSELSEQSQPIDCFAIPVLSRRDGLLLNIPRGAVSEEALLESLHGVDETALLGPSKGIPARLSEEDDEGNVVVRDEVVNSLVVDFSDDVLPLLREYGAAGEEQHIMPFVQEAPNALSVFSEILDASTAWIAQQGSDRVNFYSALEDPEEPVGKAAVSGKGGSKKSPAPKRVTNAQVLDQLSVLVAQVQSLSARQDALEFQPAKSALDPPGGNTAGAQSVSAGLSKSPGPMPAFAKYTQLVGPPPKVRAAIPKIVVTLRPQIQVPARQKQKGPTWCRRSTISLQLC